MRNVLLLSICLLPGMSVYAQNVTTQTIRWHISQTQDINGGRVYEDTDQIVSYGTGKVEWQNAQGVVKKTFIINETNGSWPNVQNNGSILYEVRVGDQPGTLRIFRTAGELTVRIMLIKDDQADPDLYEMSITSFETL